VIDLPFDTRPTLTVRDDHQNFFRVSVGRMVRVQGKSGLGGE
jgi:hypothetical protein